ncbi:MAG: glycosyltransferase family 2 protein [Verrucomicrobiaceae bacterium]|nr:glycosyltransferase family 2 protein [Verrucomicrobiaceae bacterium]
MDLSFVFPCLNEEETLAQCIQSVRQSIDSSGEKLDYEIIVADNGSDDRSVQIATEMGARVVHVESRGYGAALQGGIDASGGRYVMFADADATYCYEDSLSLYRQAVEKGADMAIASRMTGVIEKGAMPFLHKRLGTPVLTRLINVLFGGRLSDCNSGFRCLRKSSYESWQVRSTGMEFASELLVKALKHNAKTVEIDSGLRCGPEGRTAHLRTWRDGMRHLLFILSERPELFELVGLIFTVSATSLQVTAFIVGPLNLLGLNIFDLHSKLLLLLIGLAGIQFYVFSCVLYLKGGRSVLKLTQRFINLDEGVLFFWLLLTLGIQSLVIAWICVMWIWSGFKGLDLVNMLILAGHLLSQLSVLAIGLLGIHVLKRG